MLEGNHLNVELNFRCVDTLCRRVDLSQEVPIVDLSSVTFFKPFALVYLGMFLRYHNSQGKKFLVRPPTTQPARGYLATQNFWARFNFNPDFIQSEALHRLTTNTSLNDIIDVEHRDDIAEEIAHHIRLILVRNAVRVPAHLIAEVMSELTDNFAQHSQRRLAAVSMQYYPNMKVVVLAIGDSGVGIRSSLATNPTYSHLSAGSHWEAALKSFEPLVSRIPGSGTGLTDARQQVIDLDGFMLLATGDGYVKISPKGTEYGFMDYDLPGVQIQLTFPERS